MAATPTPSLGFQNFFQATLTGDITASSTDILMDNIPNASQGFLVIEPDSTSNREVIFYTSKTALKVVCPSAADGRGQDDTTAVSHSTGATVVMAPVAAFFEALQNALAIADDVILARHISSFDKSNLSNGDSNPYKFSAYRNAALNIGNGTTIAFDTELFDTNSNFDTATGKYTAPVSGFYQFNARGKWATGAGAVGVIELAKNGSGFVRGGDTRLNQAAGLTLNVLLQLTAGDEITIIGYSNTTNALSTGSLESHFSGFLVSRT